MQLDRRHVLLAALGMPAGCAIQPLGPLARTSISPPVRTGSLRAPLVGQSWTYQKLDFFNSAVQDVVEETIASVGPPVVVVRRSANGMALADERHATWGQLLRDSTWDYPMTFEAAVPLWPVDPVPGARHTVNGHYRMDGGSFRYWIQVQSVVGGWERITVGAGTFDTLRVERLIRLAHEDNTRRRTVRRDTLWLSFEIGRWVARETSGRYWQPEEDWHGHAESLEDHFRWMLVSWR